MVDKIGLDTIPESLLELCVALKAEGGDAWLVGGCVRDALLGFSPKDWDIEVFHLEESKLEIVLSSLGHFELVGKQFGVRKLWFKGLEIDVALPRKERKVGSGHKGFEIVCDPHLSYKKAVLRRDFTINAMMYDPLSKELLDFHHGQQHIEQKLLKHVSLAFGEDPLRPLRAMQFAARFDFSLYPETAKLCRELLLEAGTLPSSRVWQEWMKWSGAPYPSQGLNVLKGMGWDSLYPELVALQDCPQDKFWHPEGDVWVHTCLVVDESARLSKEKKLPQQDQIVLMFSALCHDLGKPLTTVTNEDGKIVSPQHGEVGVNPGRKFLKRIGAPKWLIQHVEPLVREHVAHFSGEPTVRAVKRLAKRLLPSNISMWEMLTEADAGGRHPAPKSRPALAWVEMAEQLGVKVIPEKAVVTGKLLIKWGMQPSSKMGEVLCVAYEAQLSGEFDNETSAKQWFEKAYCKE